MAFILKNKKTIPDINQDEKNEYINSLIISGNPMMLKYINGDNVIFIHELSVNRETRIKFTTSIPWDNRKLFITEGNVTYVYPSKLDRNCITVKYC